MYEEFFITDYENEVGYEVGEYESIDHLNELAERYDTSLPAIDKELAELESRVNAHLVKMGFVW